jgi:hypothetical protein
VAGVRSNDISWVILQQRVPWRQGRLSTWDGNQKENNHMATI